MTKRQENLLRRYLLGTLPVAEQESLESQYFAQTGPLDEVWAIENQLVDDYVRGQLGQAEHRQFEQHYLRSQPHRERVALARQLLKVVDTAAAQAGSTLRQPTLWAKFCELLRGPQLAWGMALAALLMMFIGGAVWLREQAQLRAQLAAQTAQQQRARELAAQVAEAQTQNAQGAAAAAAHKPVQNSGPSPSASPKAPPPKVFSFVLTAGLLRGSAAPQPLTIPRGANQIELRLRLEANPFTAYQIQLRTVEGAPLWSRNQLKPRAGQLLVTLPANKLRVGDYILTLAGTAATGAVEEVDRYFFRVTGK